MDRRGLIRLKWTEIDGSRPDGPNYQMNWTEWIEQTEVDRTRPNWTKIDRSGQNGPNQTEWTEEDRMDLIGLSLTELD